MSRAWAAAVAALVAVRVAVPLAALAVEGRALPGLPRYDYRPLNGDAFDYYATARQFVSTVGREWPISLAAVAAGAGGLVVARRLAGRRPELGWTTLVLPAMGFGLGLGALILTMPASGAGAVGWPLVWAIPMAPLRIVGALDPDSAFAAGLALSLVANAVTVVATAYAGRVLAGRAVGLLAAALSAAWPWLSGLPAGDRGWGNGTWQVDVGLHLYSEPLSTALATTALALLVVRRPSAAGLAVAGLLLGAATAVRLSNGVLAAAAAAYVVWRLGARAAAPLVVGGLAAVPVVAAYWPIGYVPRIGEPGGFPERPFALGHAVTSWTDSILYTPAFLAALLVPAVLGVAALRGSRAWVLLAGWILGTATLYTFWGPTWEHPRFLFVLLPALFVLDAAGAVAASRKAFVRDRNVRRDPG